MEDTCFLVAAVSGGSPEFAERLCVAAAAHGGNVSGTVSEALLVLFESPEAAMGCMNRVDLSSARMLLHCAPIASRGEALGSDVVARAAAALARMEPGAPVVSTAFKEGLPPSHQARFPKHVLVEGWLPGWTFATPIRQTPLVAPAPPVALPAPVPQARRGGETERGVGEVFMRAVRQAIDHVDRRLTSSPDLVTLLSSFGRAERPLTLEEVSDEYHLTHGRSKDLLKKAVKKGYLDRLPDDTYVLISEDERRRRWLRKKQGKLRDHLGTYVLVNAGLFVVNLLVSELSPPWFLFPLLGWGLGLTLEWQRTKRQIRETLGENLQRLDPPVGATLPEPEPDAELPSPWGEVVRDARSLLEQLRHHLVPRAGSPEAEPAEMLTGYRAMVHNLAVQGARIDGVLVRFDGRQLQRDLDEAEERVASLEREGDARLASTHLDRARLLRDQVRMIGGLSRQREASILKLKNVITTLENLLLDLSQEELAADGDQMGSVLESGIRDLARYRDWLAEANAEIDRLLRE